MKELVKKYRKFFIVFSIVILTYILANFYFLLKVNMDKIIKVSIKQTLNYNIDFSGFKFKNFKTIEVKDFKLKSRDNKEIIVSTPSVYINLGFKDIFKGYLVESVVLDGGFSNIQVYNIKKVNIVDATVGHSKSGLPNHTNVKGLKKIFVKNMNTNFSDISYKIPIKRKIRNVNGELNFLDGIDVSFRGYGGEKGDEFVFFGFTKKNEKMSARIKVQNYTIDSQVSQYGRSDDYIDIYSGKADMDITLMKGLRVFGGGKITNFKGKIKNTGVKVVNGNANILFQDKRIEIFSICDFQDNKIETRILKEKDNISLDFKGRNLNIEDIISNLPQNSDILPKISGVISYFNLKATGKIIDLPKLNIDAYFRSKNIAVNEVNNFSNIKGEIFYKNELIGFKNLRFNADVKELKDYPINGRFVLDGEYKKDKSKLFYNFENIDSFADFENLTGQIDYNFKTGEVLLENNSKNLTGQLFYSKSGNVKLDFNIDNYTLKYKKKEIYSLKGNIKLEYNIKKRKFKGTKFDLKLNNNFYFNELFFSGEAEQENLLINNFRINSGKSYAYFSGKINVKDISYELSLKDSFINSNDIYFLKEIKKLSFLGKINGSIFGDTNQFEFDGELKSSKGGYFFSYNGLKSKFKLKCQEENGENKWYLKTNSSIRYFKYDEIYFQDLVVDAEYKNNILILNKVYNNLLTISGEYNIIKSVFNLNYKLNDYSLTRIDSVKRNNIDGEIKELNGKVTGGLDNLKIDFDLTKAYIKYKDIKQINLSGGLEYYNNKFILNNLKINKNVFNGEFDLKKESLDLNVKLFEQELYKYYNYPDLKYRVIGEVNLWGNLSDIKGVSTLNIDKVYLKGESLPDFSFKLSYNFGNINNFLSSGTISLNKLVILNKKGREISGVKGFLNLSTKDFKLSLDKKEFNIEDLSYIFTDEDISGKVIMDLDVHGKLYEGLKYKLKIDSIGLDYQNIHVDKFNFLVSGDEKNINLKYLKLRYGENKLDGFGDFNLKDYSYQFRLKGENINLVFLNLFKNDYLSDINGLLTIDININQKENIGKIEVSNFSAVSDKENIELKNFNGLVEFKKDEFYIDNLEGKANNGDVSLKGYWKIPKLTKEIFDNQKIIYKDFELKIYANDFNYFNNMMNIVLDTELNVTSEKIDGDLIIKDGEISKLPEIDEVSTETSAKRDMLFDKINMKLDLTVEDKVKIRIDKLSDEFTMIKDLELNFGGSGTLTIDQGKINFIGSFSSDQGALNFNNTILEINDASVIFENAEEYFPNVNPAITINSQTEVADEEIYVTVTGYYNELQLKLSSESGLSEQDISSLLLFQRTFDNTETSEVVRDILERQLSSQIFSPISDEMERIFNISNVSISSNLLTEDDEENYRFTNDLTLGAEIEISNPIYKDKLSWNLKTQFSETERGKVDNFDLWLSYKINNNLSWKTGVKQDADIKNDTLDVHLDLDFKYRIDSFFSVFDLIRKQN